MKINSITTRHYLTALCLFLTLSPLTANAGLILTGNDEVHIAMGQGRDYVGAFSRGIDKDNLSFAGSITVIDDGAWGLTTKHQVLQSFSDPNSLYGAFAANFGNNILTNPGATFHVQAAFVHPTKDQALLYFGAPIPGITPIQRFRDTITIGMEGYTTGFGDRQYVNDPNVVFTGDRRSGFDVIQTGNASSFQTRVNDPFSHNHRTYELGLRTGYSGGPFEIAQINLLGGINTAGIDFNGFGTPSVYGTLDNTWIDTRKSSVPEPSSFALVGFSLYGLARTRFRRRREI